MRRFELRNIEAWRDCEGGWTWNSSIQLEDGIYMDATELTPRKILRNLRKWGYLTEESKGKVRVEFMPTMETIVEIQSKATGEPLLCLHETST